MVQQTTPRDSRGRFVKTKPSYKELTETIALQNQKIARLEAFNECLHLEVEATWDFLENNLPCWKKKALAQFKEQLTWIVKK